LIVADDLGWHDVGFNGSKIRTPNLDALATAGARLDQFYVQPTCSPTRAALMTGRYPMRSGSHRMVWRPWHLGGVPLDERFISQALNDAGYTTAILGKWHLGMASNPYTPNDRGFDHQYGHLGGHLDYFKHTYYGGLDWHRNGKRLDETGYSTDLIADEAVRLIQKQPPTTPLFLYVPFNAPHGPLHAHDRDVAAYKDVFSDEKRRIYAGMVTCMDRAIGRIVTALEAAELRQNTLIMFCSDNGGATNVGANNGTLRGSKGTLYEGGIRVPCLANWPNKIKADTLVSAPLHVVDLFPTFVTLAGGSLEQALPLDGRDAWNAISKGDKSPHDDICLNVVAGSRGAIRRGQWKLIMNGDSELRKKGGPTVYELFDLNNDPNETTDLSKNRPELVADLAARLKAYSKEQGRNPGYTSQPKNWKPKSYWGTAKHY
jgi:arylsulfatase A-like enzyme